jgi:hypothetical protein
MSRESSFPSGWDWAARGAHTLASFAAQSPHPARTAEAIERFLARLSEIHRNGPREKLAELQIFLAGMQAGGTLDFDLINQELDRIFGKS